MRHVVTTGTTTTQMKLLEGFVRSDDEQFHLSRRIISREEDSSVTIIKKMCLNSSVRSVVFLYKEGEVIEGGRGTKIDAVMHLLS